MHRFYQKIKRRSSKKITVGSVDVGGDSLISVQSMTNTLTSNTKATLDQIKKNRVEIAKKEGLNYCCSPG